MNEPRLRRLRWGVRGALLVGVAASVTANILHARDNPISQAIAAWPPLALLLTVELISRVPIHSKTLAFVRFSATAVIAGIAAWVSYWHMAAVAARYGETSASPYLLPLSVDGLIVVASICLVELTARITDAEQPDLADQAAPASGAHKQPADQPGHEPDQEASDTRPDLHDVDPLDHDGRGDDDAASGDALPDAESGGDGPDLADDLVPLLPAARAARDELMREGATVGRDALAARLRRNGTPIRNTRVSELLAALKAETQSDNDARPKASV
ncbi:DUF2637 domain-containing protein [Actinoplanes sp. NBRC 103695]|uniref:DUF2637 domain-containing protein n=1 Tax=Actinoplanes sp. NBRC 103695 TaxID=3032202 RepID=UPI0024A2865D|nr:DUF2637 domain-containing protein [Actinoplanes sp. NBRC 103695]GLZ01892.1 hypothetical protein Acsp02_91430 [Actinoplanes sp. NBRC 103695]